MPASEPGPLAAEQPTPQQTAEAAGLRYVSPDGAGIRREPAGDGFRYLSAKGEPIEDEATLQRIRALAIPPAWQEVWICPRANGHLQATGRDARGRKQYRYHPQFREVRESTKYEHLLAFARALPALRARVQSDMAPPGLPREKVLATVVHLLETTLIRVGNDDYARSNRSYGLTTLRRSHVKVQRGELLFQFKGKSGRSWRLCVGDRRVARIVRACQELPGQELFAYVDDAGETRDVSSSDVNDYLREISGRDITAKDFRTWSGTVMAAMALQAFEPFDTQAAARRNLRAAIEQVASRLGNTPTICRKCYVHPELLQAYASGALLLEIKDEVERELREDLHRLRPEEAAVLSLLETRLARSLEGASEHSLVALNGAARQPKKRRQPIQEKRIGPTPRQP
jgi:DNA topoisomerase-1